MGDREKNLRQERNRSKIVAAVVDGVVAGVVVVIVNVMFHWMFVNYQVPLIICYKYYITCNQTGSRPITIADTLNLIFKG